MSLDLHHLVSGQGPDLVLLHGLFGSARNWLGVQRKLEKSHTVHALDLRNHGVSPWHNSMTYTDMAQDVIDYLDQQGIEQAIIVGHSMGGKAAMAMALMAPHRVNRLISVDIAPVAYSHSMRSYVQAMQKLDLDGVTRRSLAGERLAKLVDEPTIRAFLLQNLIPGEPNMRWRLNLNAIEQGLDGISRFDVEHLPQQFNGRSFFIAGELSHYIQAQHQARIDSLFPDSKRLVVQGAGHWVHSEQAVGFMTALQQCL